MNKVEESRVSIQDGHRRKEYLEYSPEFEPGSYKLIRISVIMAIVASSS